MEYKEYKQYYEMAIAKEEMSKLARFPDENPNPVLRFSDNGVIFYGNPAAKEILAIWGKKEWEEAPSPYKELIKKSFDSNKVYSFELSCNKKIFSFVLKPIIESQYVNAYGLDITNLKDAEAERSLIIQQLEKSNEELEQSNKELEEFAYVASHDLQEPLRVIGSYCQIIDGHRKKLFPSKKEAEEIDGYFNYIFDATLRMKTLIKELLDFSRVGRRDKPFEEIKLDDLLKEVLIDFEVKVKETKAEIVVEGDLPIIFAIRFRIKQLFHNLISNSLKFRSEKIPFIRIGCCDEDSCWLFYIKDNGLGIESKYMDRVFGIFKRLYSREEYPGTGIGLALCKRIVEAHGGRIWIDSEKGQGTYIYFTISKSIEFQED